MVVSLLLLFALTLNASENTAIMPVPKLENDSYDWYQRHERICKEAKSLNPEIVFIGDSITHFWAGCYSIGGEDALVRWKKVFGKYDTLNIGFGWDRVQNVLWRIDNGELDGIKPKVVVVQIGTNNTSETVNARENTALEVAEGVFAVVRKVHAKCPKAKIILFNVFPRGTAANSAIRKKVEAFQQAIAKQAEKAKAKWFQFVDIGNKFLIDDGTLPKALFYDGTHPTDAGYEIWAQALLPLLP